MQGRGPRSRLRGPWHAALLAGAREPGRRHPNGSGSARSRHRSWSACSSAMCGFGWAPRPGCGRTSEASRSTRCWSAICSRASSRW